MNPSIPYFGEFLALITAVVWAFAVILFKKSGETVHPLALNLFKNTLASLLLFPTLWLLGESFLRPVPFAEYGLLLLSGALGIGIADTLFFASLNILGASLSAVVDCLYSPSIISLSVLWLGETLSLWQTAGAVLIISAVLVVTFEKSKNPIPRRRLWLGIVCAALSMFTMAVSIVGVKPLLERSPLVWVSEVRLLGGIAMLVVLLLFRRNRKEILFSLHGARSWGYTISGSFIGAYVSLLLWLGGMKFTQASIAAALNQTSNILVFVFAAIFLREPITGLRTLGILLGVCGAYLVTFG